MDTTTAKTMTVADELRTAAAALRDARAGVTRGPWVPYPTISSRRDDGSWTISRPWCNNTEQCEPDCGHEVLKTGAEGCEEDSISEGDVAWICLVNPDLAEPLAALLDDVAGEAERHEAHGMGNSQDEIATGPFLAVARAINGGTA